MATTRRDVDDEVMLTDVPQSPPHADHEDIARRAFARYEQRGREHGHDVDDWLDAERDLERWPADR